MPVAPVSYTGSARLEPPRAIVEIAERLEGAGFETWCVGGAVRDALLGVPHLDWDLATAALPNEVRRLFPRTVPVGIEHGTVGVLDRDGRMHEVTTFRADVETDGRHAVVRFGVSLDEDLARRDFTINAMAWSTSRGVLHDPFDGRGDLARGIVRAVGEPRLRMAEDRLRALRALRFAARFDFDLDPATWDAIVESAPSLGRLSIERVKQEWEKTLKQVTRPSRALERWRASGALRALMPALHDVPAWAFAACDHVPRPEGTTRAERADLRYLVRLALPLLPLSPTAARGVLRDLRCSNHELAVAGTLVEAWRAHGDALALAATATPAPAALRRLAAAIGRTRVAGVLRACDAAWRARADAGLSAPTPTQAARLAHRLLRTAWREPVSLADLVVTGDDLRVAGIPPGPRLGATLQRLLGAVLDDPARNTREALLALAVEE
jgi:tRNA nucleotidyltransferase (CCA-adding enzyme)